MSKISRIVKFTLLSLVVFGFAFSLMPGKKVSAQTACSATGINIDKLPQGSTPILEQSYVVKGSFASCSDPNIRHCIRVKAGAQQVGTASCAGGVASRGYEVSFYQPGQHTLEAYSQNMATGELVPNSIFSRVLSVGANSASAADGITRAQGILNNAANQGNVVAQGNAGGNQTPSINQSDPNAVVGSFKAPSSFGSIGALVVGVINFALGLIGALSLLFIIIGGVRMVASAGNEAAITAGKKTVIWAVIGLVVALLAYTIIAALEALLGRT